MDYLTFILILLGIIILIMLLQYQNSKKNDKLYIDKLNKNFGVNVSSSYDIKRLVNAKDYYDRHRSNASLDDITWNDLSMDDVFVSIDKTQSDIGSQYLYFLLRSPKYDISNIEIQRNNAILWQNEVELRNEILLSLSKLGWMKKFSFYKHLENLDKLPFVKLRKYLLLIICLIISILSVIFIGGYGVLLFIAMFICNMVVYYKDKSKINPYLSLIDHILALFDTAQKIDKQLEKYSVIAKQYDVSSLIPKIKDIKKKTGLLRKMGGNNNMIFALFELLGILFFADLIRFYLLKQSIDENSQIIDEFITILGRLDADISISDYYKQIEGKSCIPKFISLDSNEKIKITDMVHPLIASAVANSIVTNKSILLTGANASGKSTFLKSIAINIIFAQTIGMTLASSYKAPLYVVMSSMSLKDDVIAGDSYYMAEIKAIKRVYDYVNSNVDQKIKTICFVDELLRGTNTIERIAASTQILSELDKKEIFVCAATHDRELTELLTRFDNYHFEEELNDGDVTFSYKLLAGPADSRNAISLLDRLGFDKDITNKAQKMVEDYEESGVWLSTD